MHFYNFPKNGIQQHGGFTFIVGVLPPQKGPKIYLNVNLNLSNVNVEPILFYTFKKGDPWAME